MTNLDTLEIRELQMESVRALTIVEATSNNISKFNNEAHHDSRKWYKAVISWYINEYGDLPSKIGPGKDVKLIMESNNVRQD